MTDHLQLLKATAKGDQQAFRQLYDLYATKVYNICLGYLQTEVDAEEVAQDVFVKVFTRADSFQGRSAVCTWIYRIAVNACLNRIQHRKKQRPSELPANLMDYEHPGILLEKKERARQLFAAIDRLPDQQRTAFVLAFVEELPRQQVAYIMELSLKAVESLLHRAKRNLRKFLDAHRRNQTLL